MTLSATCFRVPTIKRKTNSNVSRRRRRPRAVVYRQGMLPKTVSLRAPRRPRASRGTSLRRTVEPGPDLVINHSEPILTVSQNEVTTRPASLMPLCPSALTWASALSTRFELYQFQEITIEYKPSCPTITPGVIRVRYEPDANDEPMSVDAFLASGLNMVTAAHKSKKLTIRPTNYQMTQWKYTSNVEYDRLQTYGRLHKFISSVEASVGQLWLHYRLAFRIPQIEGQIPTTTNDSIEFEYQDDLSSGKHAWGIPEGTKIYDSIGRTVATAEYVTDDPTVNAGITSLRFNRSFKGLANMLSNRILPNTPDPGFIGVGRVSSTTPAGVEPFYTDDKVQRTADIIVEELDTVQPSITYPAEIDPATIGNIPVNFGLQSWSVPSESFF